MIRALSFVLALGLGLLAAQTATAQPAELVGRIVWRAPVESFGGWSGFEVAPDGRSFTAISDRGLLARGQMARVDGLLADGPQARFFWLTDTDGARLGRFRTDAEGLALQPDGSFFVSFEGTHRVLRYAAPGARATAVPSAPAFAGLQRNSGLEGLALDRRGRLYTLPERSGGTERPFPVWRWRGGARWDQPFALPRRGDYLAVGLDFGPDGKLYLLERALRAVFFSTRVRRFTLDPPGSSILAEETVLQTPSGTHDNLEGLSVWRDDGGAIRLTMIADDNFRSFQTTEIVEYRLPR